MATPRPRIHGRSIFLGDEKLHVRGVTYGTFHPADGSSFPSPDRVRGDFEAMAAAGVNAVRTYVSPPLWLLDLAAEQGLRVMAGLAWEQHVAFLDDGERARRIAAEVGEQVRACEDHPAILCHAVGNEIPAPIVRWHGKRAVEGFVERLFWSAKEASPESLVTYVNYPSTEYLELPFLDLAAFNVFLEDEATFESYLARLQNLCGERPLLIAETGLDSRRHGERAQAKALGWQVRHAFGTGAAGVFVFSWTDEWHRGGHDVEDWDFGLVDRQRRPKPALGAVRDAFAAAPFAADGPWPRVSVVVCTHNGERTLPECLDRLGALSYPDHETIVVCDGSRDRSAEIAREHGAILVETGHRGLSHARNAGIARASGEIVAFLDDDAYPDPDWLRYVAAALRDGAHAGVGGPNVPPADEGWVAECVAAAPGGPIHVLTSDRAAEHVPGCNMAFRKSALERIGGFDERFHVAGDDVDVCWRLHEAGGTLGFSAGAVVMHRRRDSVRRYLKQQYGYGKAEALLERKWPSRYNRAGSSRWSGRIYDSPSAWGGRRAMVRYGTWGSGLFQSIYEPAPGLLSSLLVAPEFLLVVVALGVVSAIGLLWAPLLLALPLFAAAALATLWRAVDRGWRAHRAAPGRPPAETLKRRALTAALFLLQPLARLAGRLRNGLSPWRRRLRPGAAWPWPRTVSVWSESWRAPQAWVQELQDAFAARGGLVRGGGPFDRWDLELRAGPLGGVRIRTAVEEHGSGRQLLRARVWPRLSARGPAIVALVALLSALAWVWGSSGFGAATAIAALVLVGLGVEGSSTAMSLVLDQLTRMAGDDRVPGGEEVPPVAVDDPLLPPPRLAGKPFPSPGIVLTRQATLPARAEELPR
ncbi:MAG TPA: glycosyltransferase [Solirubrobacterales bacterium]|nr:glycosyltransferase [Solirubrobacterales bacterium]